jgi:IS5 family transposase
LGRANRILTQQTKDKNKLYAFHAPEVECISKGKASPLAPLCEATPAVH